MRKIIAMTFVGILSACGGESAESICQETSDLLRKKQGEGFTDVAMLSCINQGAARAKQDQKVIKEMLGE
jgi:hypothetical protein